ncbi:DNA-dependent DNA polymerase [Bdellovibrio sp. HCB2-146]|uniref:DNA-dependent DNA polymerase n=1 Tax=Bdellovibrio sp. HCB2-146 TaxID=3394362 RepID=UPI0039BD8F82
MKKDLLLELIETRLQDTKRMREKSHDFIQRVVHLYVLQLMKQGNIPLGFQEDVLADIEAEAIEIYRKKTYGFLTLEEYRRHKFHQNDDV